MGSEEVAELKALARGAPALAKPLRQYLQTIDDRDRAIEDDPRAVAGAPPAPDPTAIPGSGAGGFTGMEAFWNYFFWQSLSLNGYDDVSHILRISATASKCSTLETKMGDDADDAEVYRDCNSWLGPDQPGITTPDPTANTPLAASFRRRNEQPASRRGERRAAGEPDAGPLPGQPDISKPQITVPKLGDLLKLPGLDRPGDGPAPQTPEDISGLLDFLLGP